MANSRPKRVTLEERLGKQEQVLELIAPLVHACFQPPLVERLAGAAELHVAHLFLTRTKHNVDVIDSGYDISSYARNTHKPYHLQEFETIGDFLNEPHRTEATHTSGSGFAAATYHHDFETDLIYPTIHELMRQTLNQVRANPLGHPPELVELTSKLIPEEEQAEGMSWWELFDDEYGDYIGEAIAEAESDTPYWEWIEQFLKQPLEPAVHQHAETVRLAEEERHALNRAEAIRREMLAERAIEWVRRLGPDAQRHYQMSSASQAWALVRRALAEGATPEEANALIGHLKLSNNLATNLRTRLRQQSEASEHKHT